MAELIIARLSSIFMHICGVWKNNLWIFFNYYYFHLWEKRDKARLNMLNVDEWLRKYKNHKREREGEKHMNEEMLCLCRKHISESEIQCSAKEWMKHKPCREKESEPRQLKQLYYLFSDFSNIFYFGISTHIFVCALNLHPDGKL